MVSYRILGIMSGTSLDGIDMALCHFQQKEDKWSYTIEQAQCFEYPNDWKERIIHLPEASALELAQCDIDYGYYLGVLAKSFLQSAPHPPDYIASHGHTIFHQPTQNLTLQIGNGQALAIRAGLPVISNFREKDVLLGGQGAPLVPIGDQLLFSDYTYCLNIGGIANISFQEEKRIAYDICPANMVLNSLANRMGLPYDAGGALARKGQLNQPLLDQLSHLSYYHLPYPKSLGREWVENTVFPLLPALATEDLLHTFCEHIALQIGSCAPKKEASMLVTGGGAFNSYLMERITAHTPASVVIPDATLVAYKEALIFAFLGLRFLCKEPNCLSSVTGAPKDSIGGLLYQPN